MEINRITKCLGIKSDKFLKKFNITWSGDSEMYHMKADPCPFFKERNIFTIYNIIPHSCSGLPALLMMGDVVGEEWRHDKHHDLLPCCKELQSLQNSGMDVDGEKPTA
ncbi:MAG TPA: hypothetical protein VNI77_03180 [Nitrososphaera sp.]|nr:hypothetical protein [Nitrososphaera sp.]